MSKPPPFVKPPLKKSWKDRPKEPPHPVATWKADPTRPDFRIANVSKACFTDINFYEHIEGGSGGVFVLNSESSGVMVVKTANQVFQEVYGLHLGQAFSLFCGEFSFRVTSVAAFYHKTEQFQQIVSALKRLSPLRSVGLDLDCHKIQRLSEQNHLQVIEYVEGLTFRASEESAKLIFENALTWNKLGSIIAYDVLINNWDRVPIKNLWGNEGNPKNIMSLITAEKHEIIAIDQTITAIQNENLLQAYESKVKLVVRASLSGDIEQLQPVAFWILYACNWDQIGDEQLTQINEGMKKAFLSLAELEIDDTQKEEKIRSWVHDIESKTKDTMGEMSDRLMSDFKVNMFINREFITYVWMAIRAAVKETKL